MSTKVEINKIMRLFSIFTNKKWIEIEGHDETLRKFGELIESLDDKQVDLLLELTDRYTWVTYNDYQTHLRNILKKLYEERLEGIEGLYIFPIIKPDDKNDTKSGHAVMYMMTGLKTSLSQFDNIRVKTLESFKDVSSDKLKLTSKDYLILVDDFIGSGKTLENTLSEILKNDTIKDNMSIATVVIQEVALKSLIDRKINCIYGISMDKGISSYYQEPDLTAKLAIMQEIENRIPRVQKYRLGYEKSEALVTLIKTPNNTFPIFWKEYVHKGKTLKAPFQRY